MLRKSLVVWRIVKYGFRYDRLSTNCIAMSQSSCTQACSVIDLRSDTVTHPTNEMREAMKHALVGDDVYGEDPTVNRLQRVIADMLGKEAALLVPTCTMANTAAVMAHCDGRFNEIILGSESHMFLYEVGGIAQLAGVQVCCVHNLPDGTMDLQQIEAKIRSVDDHEPTTRLICIENTHNKCGGKVISLEYIKKLKALADNHNLPLHLDGARVFNASVALKVPVQEIAQYFDSVSVAFTKCLSCPVGSILAGSQSFINVARKVRKALGGGMRQAGVIAAPMLVALEQVLPKLSLFHDRAFRIANAINTLPQNMVCRVDMDGVQSNIVMILLEGKLTPVQLSQRMQLVTDEEKETLGQSISVLMSPNTSTKLRYVTHGDISDDDIDRVILKLQYVVAELS